MSQEVEILKAAREAARAYRLQYAQALLEGDSSRNLQLISTAQLAVEALDRALAELTGIPLSAPYGDEDLGALLRDLQDAQPFIPTRAA